MPDLRDELRTYIDHLAQEAELAAMSPSRPSRVVKQRARKWRLLIGGIAAVVLIVGALALAAFLRSDDDDDAGIIAGPARGSTPSTETGTSASTQGSFEDVVVFDSGRCFDANDLSVPCLAPHTNEKYASFRESGPLEGGTRALFFCRSLFAVYTGIALDHQDQYTVQIESEGGQSDVEHSCGITSLTDAAQPTRGSARAILRAQGGAVRADVGGDGCPILEPLPPGDDAQAAAIDAAQRDSVAHGSTIEVLDSYPAQRPAPPEHEFAASPFSQCGRVLVAERTWVVEVNIPELEPSESLSNVQIFVARFDDGWKVWGTY